MILILVRFMQIGRARESWQIHKALARFMDLPALACTSRFMDLPALACTSNLHEPHQNKNHSLNNAHTNHCLKIVSVVNLFKKITMIFFNMEK